MVSGEVELTVMTEKTILSVAAGEDKFKYLDLDTQLLEVEFGGALNEPVTFAVRKTIEGAVVELVNAGQKKGLWKFKAPEWINPGVKVIETVTEEELLEEIIETDNELRETQKEEVYDDYKKKPEVVEIIEVEIEEEIEVMEVGDPPGQSNGDDLEKSEGDLDEEIIPNTPVITPDIANIPVSYTHLRAHET